MSLPNRVGPPPLFPVLLSGIGAFLGLYATQPILPVLEDAFHTSKVMVSLTVTVAGLGVALAAPIAGQIADRLGRKRVIVASAFLLGLATLMNATAPTLPWLLFWRFLQGVATPGVFAVTTAYVQEEFPPERVAAGISAYISGNTVGGFTGRLLSGFAAQHFGWRSAFVVIGLTALGIACYLALALPKETHFHRPEKPAGLIGPAWKHLSNPQLLASYGIGFCVLFSLIAMFTWVTFHLAAPPYSLGAGWLGSIFVAYLAGAVMTPIAGRRIDRLGHRPVLLAAAGLAIAGVALTLGPHLWMVMAGLAVGCSGVFISQASATSYVSSSAKQDRALAVGLYVTFYYTGGSMGAITPGWLWNSYGWPGCVALVIAVQLFIAAIAWTMWTPRGAHA